VTWRVPPTAKGTYPIELQVSDAYGGKTTQSYSLAVGWDDVPANANPSPARGGNAARPAPPAAATQPPSGSNASGSEGDDDYTESDQDEEAADEEF
jgi:hypothetical protein